MKHGSIQSSTLFHPGNNPRMRLDAGFAHTLQQMESGATIEDPHKTLEALFRDDAAWKKWLRATKDKQTLEEIEDHILNAFTGLPKSRKTKLSPKIREGIRALAKKFCTAEAERLRQEVNEQIETSKKLDSFGKEETPSLETSKPIGSDEQS